MSSDGADDIDGGGVGDDVADLDDVEAIETAADGQSLPEIDEGRYLYCVVRTDVEETFETIGVDDEPVSVITEDDVGAVVHACDELYDSADLTEVRRWLVRHQTVVDDAAAAFGTPVPFQFDTILRGDDDGVREWLREEYDTLDLALSELTGHWEYRVEVRETEPISDEALIDHDDRLAELAAGIDDAEEGTAFLLETKFENRLKELRAGRRESLTADVQARLDEHAREVHALERAPAASLSAAVTDDETDAEEETLCRLTLLADEADEEAIGSVLDDVAATEGLTVRFTGPWPPYTFAPELGGDDERSADANT